VIERLRLIRPGLLQLSLRLKLWLLLWSLLRLLVWPLLLRPLWLRKA